MDARELLALAPRHVAKAGQDHYRETKVALIMAKLQLMAMNDLRLDGVRSMSED